MFTRMLTPKYVKLSSLSSTSIRLQLADIVRHNQWYSSDDLKKDISSPLTTNSTESKKKQSAVPKITLLSGDELNITTLEDAQKRAKRRDLKLVKIVDIDTKTQRPVYKLMTGAEYHKEDLKQRERKKAEKQSNPFKGEKVLIVGQNISEHDLQIHCLKILKWLDKHFEVRIVINGDIENIKKAESIYKLLEEKLTGHGRIVQKRQKGSDIRFQVLPPKESKANDDNQKKEAAGNLI